MARGIIVVGIKVEPTDIFKISKDGRHVDYVDGLKSVLGDKSITQLVSEFEIDNWPHYANWDIGTCSNSPGDFFNLDDWNLVDFDHFVEVIQWPAFAVFGISVHDTDEDIKDPSISFEKLEIAKAKVKEMVDKFKPGAEIKVFHNLEW